MPRRNNASWARIAEMAHEFEFFLEDIGTSAIA
jgi:hypothetical protein